MQSKQQQNSSGRVIARMQKRATFAVYLMLLVIASLAAISVTFSDFRSHSAEATSINIWKHRYPFYGGYGGYYPFWGGYGGYGGFGFGGYGRR